MKNKKLVLALIIAILFSIFYEKIAMAKTATVDTDTLKLRKEASTDSTVLELLNQGEKLDVIEVDGDWVKVKAKGMTGYVSKEYVKLSEETTNTEKENKAENTTSNEVTSSSTTENTIQNKVANEVSNEIALEPGKIDTDKKETIKNKNGTINVDTNLSILPLINATKILEIKKDAKITIVDEIKEWYYVQTDEASGWIRKVQVNIENDVNEETVETNSKPVEQENKENTVSEETNVSKVEENTDTEQLQEENSIEETEITQKTMYVNYSSIYVRKGPGTDYDVVDSLILNSDVIVIAEAGDWYKIKVGTTTGYVAKRLLSNTKQETTSRSADERVVEDTNINNEETNKVTTVQATSKGQEIAQFAKQYLGCKYVYGGSGPSTFDCSGFTMYVFKHFGVSLSHSATAQSKNGSYVAKEDLQPGDLVFFKDYQTMDGIGHCGIYIGNGDFIHASSGTGYCVKISTLLSGSYNTRYETARRLF